MKRIALFNNWRFILLFIFGFNLLLRLVFIFYGYITHDEGIAIYNNGLAYSGLKPFIDYNGWNSLINDYFFGFTRLFLTPTILTQRFYAFGISIIVFWLTLTICRWLGSRILVITCALLLTTGSLTYTYLSNIPYSEQLMTLCIMFSLYFFTKAHSNKHYQFFDFLCILSLLIGALARSQVWPLVFLFAIYFLFLRNSVRNYFKKMIICLSIALLILFGPFVSESLELTIYAIIWPFFSNKILIYVWNTPAFNLSQLINFLASAFRDYGIFISFIAAGSVTIINRKDLQSSPKHKFIGLCLLIIAEFFLVSLIHRPADSNYIYPVVPVMAIVCAFFFDNFVNMTVIKTRIFLFIILASLLVMHAITYPHFKIIKTSLKTINQPPYKILKVINNYISTLVFPKDEVIAFYLPAITELPLQTPLFLNEGPGSLSVLDENIASKYHLTSLPAFRDYIASEKAKLLIFPSTSVYFFGKDDTERNQTQEVIFKHYELVKEFNELSLIDGSKASLRIFRLPQH